MKTLLAVVGVLVLGACRSNTFGFRDERCDPDVRLAELLADWDAARAGTNCRQGRAVVDCDHVRADIETLSFEFPAHQPTLMANAMIAFEVGEREKSRRYLDQLFALRVSHPEAAILHARLAVAEGNLEGARTRMLEQVRLRPDHAGLREALASLCFLGGDLDDADRELAAAEQLGAPAWRIDYHRGLLAESRGEIEDGIALYERALAANDGFGEARARLEGLRAGR